MTIPDQTKLRKEYRKIKGSKEELEMTSKQLRTDLRQQRKSLSKAFSGTSFSSIKKTRTNISQTTPKPLIKKKAIKKRKHSNFRTFTKRSMSNANIMIADNTFEEELL